MHNPEDRRFNFRACERVGRALCESEIGFRVGTHSNRQACIACLHVSFVVAEFGKTEHEQLSRSINSARLVEVGKKCLAVLFSLSPALFVAPILHGPNVIG
jgi:hypothetical protein